MSRRNRHSAQHEEPHEEHSEPWLVSYADMMTLLFGFFVLMYSFASKEKKEDWEKVRADVAKYFGGEYITPYDQVAKDIDKAVEKTPLANQIDKRLTPEGLELTFRSTVLFESGRETIQPETFTPMESLAKVILERKDSVMMVVEGHTDDEQIATGKFPSNWELSAARAATVLRLFEKLGFPRDHLQASAFADTRPLFPNRDGTGHAIAENQARNRRVVIRLTSFGPKQPPGAGERARTPAGEPAPRTPFNAGSHP